MRPRKEALMTTMLRKLEPLVRELDTQYPVAEQSRYQMSDCLLSVLAMFTFKQPNLFRFEQRWDDGSAFQRSVRRLFRLSSMPSDTTIRRRLDELPPEALSPFFQAIFRYAQRQKWLEAFRSPLDGHLLLAIDGTSGVSSATIHCDRCLQKRHRRPVEGADETSLITYSHQTLGAVLVHPDERTVLPLCPEAIAGRNEAQVQDSELSAAHRWVAKFRGWHPQLAVVFLGDAWYANGPFVEALNQHKMKYMIRVKPAHKGSEYRYLAPAGTAWIQGRIQPEKSYRMWRQEPLNHAHQKLLITVLQECDANGKVSEWITNRECTAEQVETAVAEARRRWQIENATFQTLKGSQGPHFEHNHGHGRKHLASIFPLLMMLQFLLEQLSERVCRWYQAALAGPKKKRLKSHYWDDQFGVIRLFVVSSWEKLYEYLADPPVLPLPDR